MPELAKTSTETIVTLIPARLDRLPWCRFHWLLVVGLGITWILDGLEVTMMGAVGAVLQNPDTLHFTAAQIGLISSSYLTGAVLGSLVFGPSHRSVRPAVVFLPEPVYLLDRSRPDCLLWNLASFAIFRFLTGAGIGGEYSSVNSPSTN